LGFQNSGFQGFKCQTVAQNISQSSEKVKVGPVLQDFGIQGFGVSNVKQKHKTFPEVPKNVWGPTDIGFRHLVMLDARTTSHSNC
jgi:hypothetical protein